MSDSIRDDDFKGFLLDRSGGSPTLWSCIWCQRYARTVADIEHPSRCPISRLAALARENDALRVALAPILAYLLALVESANHQGNRELYEVPSDKLAAVNDVPLLRSDIARLAAAAADAADIHAQMVQANNEMVAEIDGALSVAGVPLPDALPSPVRSERE